MKKILLNMLNIFLRYKIFLLSIPAGIEIDILLITSNVLFV